MAFHFSNLFGLGQNANTVNMNKGTEYSVSSSNTNLYNSAMASKLMALLPGQTLQGEVVSVQGNQVQLLLGNEMLLNASLENQLGINPGQLMSFQIKSNTGSLLSLIPLSVNLTSDENVMKALNEANLPVTDKTVEMVNNLMKEGMPIDKETLINVNKELMANPQAEVSDVVQMMRLKIPVTEQNLEQFQAYKNYNHQLSEGIKELQGQLFDLVNGSGSAEGVSGDKQFMLQLLRFIAGEHGATETVTLKDGQAALADGVQAGNASMDGALTQSLKGAGQNGLSGAESELPVQNSVAGNIADATVSEGAGQAPSEAGVVSEDKLSALNTSEKDALFAQLKELGVSDKTIALLKSGQLDMKQLAMLLQEENLSAESMTKLFASKEFGKLFQDEMMRQMLLSPDKISKEDVHEYFSRLQEQTSRLMHILDGAGQLQSAAGKSVQNINQNVDFMNQLNQMFTYVQLPLKMAQDSAHGDLYVYTNKKNLAKKDGNVSALLHLDMPNLGMLDVYVAMQSEKVSTKFYLQDESALEFLEQNMELLTERLQKRGYNASAQVVLREKNGENGTIMQEMLKDSKNIPGSVKIGTRSFDVRA